MAAIRLTEYQRFISRMEVEQRLDRALEGVPTDDVLAERKTLTRPELAVLLSYAKTYLKERLIRSSIHADAVISETVFEEFPPVIRERYAVAARKHRLYREIVATIVANDVVHHLGISSVVHLSDFVGGGAGRDRKGVLRRGALFRHPRDVPQHRIAGTRRRRDPARHAAADHPARTTFDAVAAAAAAQRVGRGRVGAALRDQHRASVGVAPRADGRIGPRATRRPTTTLDARRRAGRGCRIVRQRRCVGNHAAGDRCRGATRCCTADGGGDLRESECDVVDRLAGRPAVSSRAVQPVAGNGARSTAGRSDERPCRRWPRGSASKSGASGGESGAVDGWLARQSAFARSWRAVLEGPQRATTQDFSLLSMTCRKLGDLIRTLPAAPG